VAFYPGVAETSIEVDGHRIRIYDSVADHGGRRIVLAHGTGGSAEDNYWALFPMLAMRHRVIAFDFADPPEPDVDQYVAQAAGVIGAVSPDEPADVLGYSFGAVVTAILAARQPELIRSLTLVAGWLRTDAQQRLRNDVWRALYEEGHSALPAFTVFTSYSQRFLNAQLPGGIDKLVERVRTGPDRGPKMVINRSIDIEGEAAEIVAPTLIVGCAEDQTAPLRHSHLLFGAISNARLATIDSGHGVMTERPAEVFTLVDSFIREPAATDPGTVLESTRA
jgi:pimeloyl-ACP methyl ester carboxylesterase